MVSSSNDDIDKRLEYFELLQSKREKWQVIWNELKKYVCPQTESNKAIFDSTSIWSREQLASGLQSLLVNPAMSWFNIRLKPASGNNDNASSYNSGAVQEDSEQLKLIGQIVEQSIFEIFNNPAANFYNQIHQFFLNLAAFGTSVFYVEEEPILKQKMFFRNIDLKECYFEENKYGMVDSMYRLFTISIKLAASRWSDNKELQEKLSKNPDQQIEILHIVTPQDNNNGKAKNIMAYDSLYIYFNERKLLSSSGYSYFPFLVTRWVKEEGEAYGYAPAHHVLPDIKLLNSLRQITLKVAQKQLDPPLLVPKDGYYLPLYTSPGSVNFYRNGIADKIVPLTGMENILPTELEQNQCREAIFKAFYVDIFRMQKENKEMTAAEVGARSEEQMRLMSPMVGRIETEFLNPLIMIVYQTLLKYNMLPAMENLSNVGSAASSLPDIDIDYVSPLSKAQKSSAIVSIEQVLGFFQRIGIAGQSPEIYDNINFDECFKLIAALRGVPQTILRSEQEVNQIRQQRQLAALQQQGGGSEIIN